MSYVRAAAVKNTKNAALSNIASDETASTPRHGEPQMQNAKSTKVPKGWEETFAVLTGLTDRFSAEHLNQEYADLARHAIAALCRKRPSPLVNGNPQTWACAVLYALGQNNFLADKASKPWMAMADLCGHFGIAASTGGNKAKLVRQALRMQQFDHRWTLPSRLASSPLVWMIEVNGIIADARNLPVAVQEAAVRKGFIPYVFQIDGDERAEPPS